MMESVAMESGAIGKFGMEFVVMDSASSAFATVVMEFSVVESGTICNSGVTKFGTTSICESGSTSISKSGVMTSSGSCDSGVMTSAATPARSPATPPHPRCQTPRRAPPAPPNSMANQRRAAPARRRRRAGDLCEGEGEQHLREGGACLLP
ncbi:hypothetical protein SEVIR_3G028966v4 [Setaria viridis]